MFKVTMAEPVRNGQIEVKPNLEGTGIIVNGVPVNYELIVHSRERVDICKDRRIIYLIEHHVAALTLAGITDAQIVSHRRNWDFYRPEDRSAYSTGSTPDTVLGDPAGVIGRSLVESLMRAPKVALNIQQDYLKPNSAFEITHKDYGYIKIAPLTYKEGLVIDLNFYGSKLYAHFKIEPPHLPRSLICRISEAVTPFLAGSCKKAIYHVIGDLIGDLIGIGKIFNAEVKADLRGSYHYLTIHLIKKIRGSIRL